MEIIVRTSNLDLIDIGELQARYSADGYRILSYYISLRHKELHAAKQLTAPLLSLLQTKVDALVASWDAKLVEHRLRQLTLNGRSQAERMTVESGAKLDGLGILLSSSLARSHQVDWASLKDFTPFSHDSRFSETQPARRLNPEPIYIEPAISVFDWLLGKAKEKRISAENAYRNDLANWQALEEKADYDLRLAFVAWQQRKADYEARAADEKGRYEAEQTASNAKIDQIANGLITGDVESVEEFAAVVLDASDYDELFEKAVDVTYRAEDQLLGVQYQLPSPDDMPRVKSVRFVAATGELKETLVSDREQKANYDLVCYQICLRTLHELFSADVHKNIVRILFNGYATFVDRTTGNDATSCIMSILVERADFEIIDLGRVDPKACFKSLKGVSASSLAALAPVPPVMTMDRQDKRFIEGRVIIDALENKTNIAAMDWEDFEHLVRELFEKEFASRGGEVRVTQSSSDGGVDAIAFDPDPITGGKIVIQAKRYTNTVGVSAVRDLFGTMQHEGASKGILITTADYGPDAHKFATGKPIALLSGANLLHLLNKHGYAARIDLREARRAR